MNDEYQMKSEWDKKVKTGEFTGSEHETHFEGLPLYNLIMDTNLDIDLKIVLDNPGLYPFIHIPEDK